MDHLTVKRFIAMCERNGAAKRVRLRYRELESEGDDRTDGMLDTLEYLGLTALLSEPGPCARCESGPDRAGCAHHVFGDCGAPGWSNFEPAPPAEVRDE